MTLIHASLFPLRDSFVEIIELTESIGLIFEFGDAANRYVKKSKELYCADVILTGVPDRYIVVADKLKRLALNVEIAETEYGKLTEYFSSIRAPVSVDDRNFFRCWHELLVSTVSTFLQIIELALADPEGYFGETEKDAAEINKSLCDSWISLPDDSFAIPRSSTSTFATYLFEVDKLFPNFLTPRIELINVGFPFRSRLELTHELCALSSCFRNGISLTKSDSKPNLTYNKLTKSGQIGDRHFALSDEPDAAIWFEHLVEQPDYCPISTATQKFVESNGVDASVPNVCRLNMKLRTIVARDIIEPGGPRGQRINPKYRPVEVK